MSSQGVEGSPRAVRKASMVSCVRGRGGCSKETCLFFLPVCAAVCAFPCVLWHEKKKEGGACQPGGRGSAVYCCVLWCGVHIKQGMMGDDDEVWWGG